MTQILPIFASVYRYFWRAMQGVTGPPPVSVTRAALFFQFDFTDPKSALEVDFVNPTSASNVDFADPKSALEFDFDLETVI